MEKSNVQIDWGSWDDNQTKSTPKNSKDDKPFEVKETPTSWGDYKSQETTSDSEINTYASNPDEKKIIEEWGYKNESNYSLLGVTKNIELNPEVYIFDVDNKKAIEGIDFNNLEPFDDEEKYKIKSKGNAELTRILSNIKEIALEKGADLDMFYLIKNVPQESSVNIFRGKPKMNFIYVLAGNKDSGNFVLDLSALGGPTNKVFDTREGLLVIFEGWVPYRITKNLSEKNLLVIAGNLN